MIVDKYKSKQLENQQRRKPTSFKVDQSQNDVKQQSMYTEKRKRPADEACTVKVFSDVARTHLLMALVDGNPTRAKLLFISCFGSFQLVSGFLVVPCKDFLGSADLVMIKEEEPQVNSQPFQFGARNAKIVRSAKSDDDFDSVDYTTELLEEIKVDNSK